MQRFLRLAVAGVLGTLFMVGYRVGAVGANEPRLRVAVVIDASGSMQVQDPGLLSKVAARLFVELAGPNDEVGIVEFGTTARLIDRAFVKDEKAREKLFAAIEEVGRSQWCTDYVAGLRAALSMFEGPPKKDERRLVIFLTDGTYDPDRSNETYYELLTPGERDSLWSKRAQDLLEKARTTDDFRDRPCHPRYDALEPAVRRGFHHAFDSFVEKELKPSGVRVFSIGFGSELSEKGRGRKAELLSESLGFLERLAKESNGRTLIEDDVNKIPGFFAEIFAALVGAPVQGFPGAGETVGGRYVFNVLKGTSAVGVVVPTEGDRDFEVSLKGPIGDEGRKWEPRRTHNEVGEERRTKGRVLSGYRFFWISDPPPGEYALESVKGRQKNFSAHVLMDVGLQLAWVEPAPRPVYAEEEKGELEFKFALRTASGEKVGGLSESFMRDMEFNWLLGRDEGLPVLEKGSPRFDPSDPMRPMSIRLERSKLEEGKYTLAAWAAHSKGFFELRRLRHDFDVLKYIEMNAVWKTHDFSEKASKGFRVAPWIELTLEEDIKARQDFELDFSGVSNRERLVLTLANDTPGCKVEDREIKGDRVVFCMQNAGGKVVISLALANWKELRSEDMEFAGKVVLTPKNPEIFRGEKSWETQVGGKLVAWTFWDWVRHYRNWLLLAAGVLILIIWLVGRAIAGAFPPKAVFYYLDLEDKTDDPSQYALGRRARSRLPFVSAKHTVGGRKGMPRAPGVFCMVKATSGGFDVYPKAEVSYEREGEKIETRSVVRGRFDEHYRVGDRYEFWIARRPEY